ncbi:MAG: LPS export ABC transporter periplasmic protein LptC [Bacteroidales bacterium]|nr:LPS export ABC transporter periplasmic protein LptC [Bacteroidales bacterium]
MRLLPFLTALAVLAACSREHQRFVPNASDPSLTPTMATTDVSTLISDSGYTRYHLKAPLWQMFEDADEPFWKFPDGLEVEQYDLAMNPESTVVCDSAIYFSRKRLWRLDGNVVMVNTQADSFLTQQLFWDQAERKIYSDSFVHIVRTDRTIEGFGFESDQSMLYYTVNRPTAILPANRPGAKESAKTQVDNASADTAQTSAPVRRQNRPKKNRPKNGFLVGDDAAAKVAPKK